MDAGCQGNGSGTVSAPNEVIIRETPAPPDLKTPEGRAAFKLTANMLHPSEWIDKPLPEIEWVIDRRIDAESLVMIAAEEGTGKSIITTNMAHKIATGGTFMGSECTKTPVLYYVLDEPRRNLQRRLQSQNLPKESNLYIFYEKGLDENTTEELVKSLERKAEFCRLEHGKVPVIFLDTMTDVLDIQELNNHSEVVRKLGQLRELIRRTGCTVVMTHHYNKNESANPRNRVTGAKGLRSKCDTIYDILFSEPGNSSSQRTIQTTKVRNADWLPATAIEYDKATQLIEAGALILSEEQRESAADEKTLLDALAVNPAGLCTSEIKALISDRRAPKVISRLTAMKRIAVGLEKKIGGKSKCPAYVLAASLEDGPPVTL